MKDVDLQHFEIKQLLEAIYFRYGYDFRDYARASLERKIINRVTQSKLHSISQMTSELLHDSRLFNQFLKDMSVTVTEMFRDPYVFKKLSNTVFEQLKTYSRINIWHVGCATGEEAYSMAILLHENDLLKRTRIYATDYNNHSLDIAKKGLYDAAKINQYAQSYRHAGGKYELSDYYQCKHGSAIFNHFLKEHITFANHNLMKDQAFAQMHLISCRNVMIYFNANLQNRVVKLFAESLVHRGFLLIGDKESLEFNEQKESFEQVAQKERIYRKTSKL
ncbi:chemotaxis protein CheR [Psychromonas sp. psych-6C06]|nr:chemotaxis protein CheR [Psychromonas sp. psych-6C06]